MASSARYRLRAVAGLACCGLLACAGSRNDPGDQGSSGNSNTGAEGQPCFPNDTCLSGLTCLSRVCVVVPGSSSGTGGNTSPGHSSTSSTSGGGLSSGSSSSAASSGGGTSGTPAPLATFLRRVAEVVCHRKWECGDPFSTPQECLRYAELVAAAWSLASGVTVGASAQACLDGLAELGCEEVDYWNRSTPSNEEVIFMSHPEIGACLTALTGTAPLGAECNAGGLDCQAGLVCMRPGQYCAPQGMFPRPTCQPPRGLGAPCASVLDCQPGLACDDDHCRQPAAPGQPCTAYSSVCGPAGLCWSTSAVCWRWGREGDACGAGSYTLCDPPLQCSSDVCRFAVASGGECSRDAQCPVGESCVGSTCQLAGEPGEWCDTPRDCSTGSCDLDTRSCRGTTAPGQPCVNADTCTLGLFCTAGECQPPGNVGAPCSSDAHCLSGTWCPAEVQSTCQPLGQYGAPCDSRGGRGGRGCAAGYHCEGRDGAGRSLNTCQALGTMNAPCRTNASCSAGLLCFSQHCQSPGTAGASCLGWVDGNPCAVGLLCNESSVCEPANQRQDGSECATSGVCASNNCSTETLTCETYCFP